MKNNFKAGTKADIVEKRYKINHFKVGPKVRYYIHRNFLS